MVVELKVRLWPTKSQQNFVLCALFALRRAEAMMVLATAIFITLSVDRYWQDAPSKFTVQFTNNSRVHPIAQLM